METKSFSWIHNELCKKNTWKPALHPALILTYTWHPLAQFAIYILLARQGLHFCPILHKVTKEEIYFNLTNPRQKVEWLLIWVRKKAQKCSFLAAILTGYPDAGWLGSGKFTWTFAHCLAIVSFKRSCTNLWCYIMRKASERTQHWGLGKAQFKNYQIWTELNPFIKTI